MLRQAALQGLARARGGTLQRAVQTSTASCQDKVAPEGKHEEDPQNTEGTLTDNTDSRVGLKDTTDTTPGYFYKNEVTPDAASSGPGLDGGKEQPRSVEPAADKQASGAAPPDTRKPAGLPKANIPLYEGLSTPSKEEEEARSHEFSGTLVQPPKPPEMRAATHKGSGPPEGPPPGPPGADPEGTQSFAQQVEGDMKDTFANVKWGQKPDPAAMPGDPRQHYKP